MLIRPYTAQDKEACMAIFDSNCPKFFDESEKAMFSLWLDHQADAGINYRSPTYTNAVADVYYVIESPNKTVIACAGFYVLKELKEARLAWGMIHADLHNKGYGTLLYSHRKKMIQQGWPDHAITLCTSQFTFAFYEKMGMKVTSIIKAGFGPNLDRYDMVESSVL